MCEYKEVRLCTVHIWWRTFKWDNSLILDLSLLLFCPSVTQFIIDVHCSSVAVVALATKHQSTVCFLYEFTFYMKLSMAVQNSSIKPLSFLMRWLELFHIWSKVILYFCACLSCHPLLHDYVPQMHYSNLNLNNFIQHTKVLSSWNQERVHNLMKSCCWHGCGTSSLPLWIRLFFSQGLSASTHLSHWGEHEGGCPAATCWGRSCSAHPPCSLHLAEGCSAAGHSLPASASPGHKGPDWYT